VLTDRKIHANSSERSVVSESSDRSMIREIVHTPTLPCTETVDVSRAMHRRGCLVRLIIPYPEAGGRTGAVVYMYEPTVSNRERTKRTRCLNRLVTLLLERTAVI
jgi:hypothetical protein